MKLKFFFRNILYIFYENRKICNNDSPLAQTFKASFKKSESKAKRNKKAIQTITLHHKRINLNSTPKNTEK